MRKWTEAEAIEWLMLCGAMKTGSRTILMKDVKGLKACSAMDYLIKRNYSIKILKTYKSKKPKRTGDFVSGSFGSVSQKLWYNGKKALKRIA